MNDDEVRLRAAMSKLETALRPYPRDTQIEALRMVLNADPQTSVSITEGGSVGPTVVSTIADAKDQVTRIMERLTPEARERVGKKLREQYDAERRRIEGDRLSSAELRQRIAACEDLRAWIPPLVLERNEHSRLHKLKEAMTAGRVIDGSKDDHIAVPSEPVLRLQHTFVVKHDWAGAFTHADGIADVFKLPYETCAFEFRIGGRTVILAAAEVDHDMRYTSFIECGEYWYSPPFEAGADRVLAFLFQQVRAICIALDAEVATETVIRAPHKLNEKRIKAGKVPLVDHRVVDLSRRHRVANPAAGHGTGTKKRLHFRRGHWRHFEQSKTWVRWCLVGNPDLGFISKEYSL